MTITRFGAYPKQRLGENMTKLKLCCPIEGCKYSEEITEGSVFGTMQKAYSLRKHLREAHSVDELIEVAIAMAVARAAKEAMP